MKIAKPKKKVAGTGSGEKPKWVEKWSLGKGRVDLPPDFVLERNLGIRLFGKDFNVTGERADFKAVGGPFNVDMNLGQAGAFKGELNFGPQAGRIQRLENPDDVHGVIRVQLIPLQHRALKVIQGAELRGSTFGFWRVGGQSAAD